MTAAELEDRVEHEMLRAFDELTEKKIAGASYPLKSSNIDDYLDCGLNIFEMFWYGASFSSVPLNFSHDEFRRKLVWSWENPYPDGSGSYAKLSGETDRFGDAPDSDDYAFACRKMGTSGSPAFNEWYVTTASGTFTQGEDICLQETKGEYVFAVPRSKYELNELVSARSGSADLWLNYHKGSGKWVADIGIRDANWLDVNDNGQHDDHENKPPTAIAGPDQQIVVGQSVTLDGSASTDPNTDSDYDIASYAWDFGDSNSDTGVQVTHRSD